MAEFKVYKSSAGSGKTYTLVREYLLLCLADESAFHFSKILAITFTNKAAEEMKNRILKALKEIGQKEKDQDLSDLKESLIEQLNLSQEQVEKRAADCLTAIMHNYADFNVSTIDKFSHRLIRTFAKDLGLSINFKVDLQLDLILEDLVHELIEQVGKDEKISKALLAHTQTKIISGKAWDPREELFDLSKASLNESAINYLKAAEKIGLSGLLKEQTSLINENQLLKTKLRNIGNKGLDLIEDAKIDISSFAHGRYGIPGFFRKLFEFNYKTFDSISYSITTVEQDKWFSGKAKDEDKREIELIKDELSSLFFEGYNLIQTEMPMYHARSMTLRYLGILGLLGQVEKVYSKIKDENRILPISDFNKKIAEVVLAEPIPFIYERLGERFDHILIDEFQDTSVMQFMNLLPLIEESLARGHRNLIVGDGKQAIYRFRGGEVEQFSEMPDFVPEDFARNPLVVDRLQNLKAHYREEKLNTNYRSLANIVQFNNQFFENLLIDMPDRVKKLFEGHQQKTLKHKTGGFVEVSFLEKGDEQQVEQCYEDILACLDDDYDFKDITILCRTKAQAKKVAEYLKTKNIPLISSESLLIESHAKVQFLISLAKHVQEPNDLTNRAHILEYMHLFGRINIDLHACHEKFVIGKTDFNAFLLEQGIQIDSVKHRSLSLIECFESLMRIAELDQDYDVYLQFFMEEVFGFASTESNSLADFFDWWEINKSKLSIDLPSGINAVQIMTLHKSKGLEFPVVIYPFISPPSNRNTKWLWVDARQVNSNLNYTLVEYKKEMNETVYAPNYQLELEREQMDLMNENYVAFTRAVERMYIRAEVLPKKEYSQEKTNLSLPHLLKQGMPSSAIETDNGYTLGLRSTKQEQKIRRESSAELEIKFYSEPWQDKLRISREGAENFSFDSERSARNYGNLFHEIMSKIDDEKQVDQVLEQYIQLGEILEDEKEELRLKVNQLMADPIGQLFFGPHLKVKKEASLLDSKGDILRPDRVVFYPDKIMVLDYKTGLMNDSHQKQMHKYQECISETSTLPVEAYLYYLEQNQMSQVI